MLPNYLCDIANTNQMITPSLITLSGFHSTVNHLIIFPDILDEQSDFLITTVVRIFVFGFLQL
jgi:hypothetical protein